MPRFSIVITTTDRPSLLRAAVLGALDAAFEDCEVLVSDNFSKQPASALLGDIADPRLRVIRTASRLPAPDHWEFVWDHVAGEYAMYLGDDNALHPGVLRVADRAIRAHDLDLVSWRVCSYLHPDWNITYAEMPNRGNVLGLQPGSSGNLYSARADRVLGLYSEQLRVSACFPNMLNFLFRKACGDEVRRSMGRLFWSPFPDMSAPALVLSVVRQGRYGYLDGFGAIGGWSRDSNLATLLSGGKTSRKLFSYYEEFGDKDLYPHHQPKFVTITNGMAAVVSQGRALMPERFAPHTFDPKTLALRSFDDMYVHGTSPWFDDPDFVKLVEGFLEALPPGDAAEARTYRDQRIAEKRQAEQRGGPAPGVIRNRSDALAALRANWRAIDRPTRQLLWRLLRTTFRNPLGSYWTAAGTTYVDMTLFGARDIAETARNLPRLLGLFDRPGEAFAASQRDLGLLGDVLSPGSALGWSMPEAA